MDHAQHATDISVQTDTIVPVDQLGHKISDEDNPAYLAGALHELKKFLERDRKFHRFLTTRTVLAGHRTIVDSRDAVLFVEGLIDDWRRHSHVTTKCGDQMRRTAI